MSASVPGPIARLLLSIAALMAAATLHPAPAAEPSEKSLVAAIRVNKPPAGVDLRFVAAVRKIDQLRGELEFDAAGRLIGVDLASDRVSLSDAELPVLAALPNLKRLRLSGGGITTASTKQIAAIGGLTDVTLINAQINDDGLGLLAGLGNLSSLSIQRSGLVTDAGLVHLGRLPKLTSLGLLDLNVTDAGLARLADLTRLRVLDLRGCPQITTAGLQRLRALKGLKVLRVRGYQIDDATLAMLKDFPNLAGLVVEEASISDAGLASLASPPLEDLGLFRCYRITDEGLRHLARLAGLRQLSLRDVPITGEGLVDLRGLPKLSMLRLNETGVGDAALEHLKGLKGLTRLELRQTQTGDAGLAVVAGLANLAYLDLENTRVTDAGLARLAGLGKLRVLNLKLNAGVSDAAVEHLGKLQGLKTLEVAQTGITPEGLRKLAVLLPGCRVDNQ